MMLIPICYKRIFQKLPISIIRNIWKFPNFNQYFLAKNSLKVPEHSIKQDNSISISIWNWKIGKYFFLNYFHSRFFWRNLSKVSENFFYFMCFKFSRIYVFSLKSDAYTSHYCLKKGKKCLKIHGATLPPNRISKIKQINLLTNTRCCFSFLLSPLYFYNVNEKVFTLLKSFLKEKFFSEKRIATKLE